MRFSPIGIIAVLLILIAVALAGCSGGSPSAPSGGGTQAAGTQAAGSAGGSAAAGGASLFGGLNYNWVEYKMTAGSGSEAMTIYYKYNKQTGKCSMRFEGAGASQMPSGMQEMDCSSRGGQTAADPNQVSSDAQISCSPIAEMVTVPAGTFSATKCTITSKGTTMTSWVVKDKFAVKMETSSAQGGSMSMVLNAYG